MNMYNDSGHGTGLKRGPFLEEKNTETPSSANKCNSQEKYVRQPFETGESGCRYRAAKKGPERLQIAEPAVHLVEDALALV